MFFEKHRPNEIVVSFCKINFERLSRLGRRNVIIDVDDMIDIESMRIDVHELATDLRNARGIHIDKISVVANGYHRRNIARCRRLEKKVAQAIGNCQIVFPDNRRHRSNSSYIEALEQMSTKGDRTCLITDEFLDIRGAKDIGLYTIYVKNLGKKTRIQRLINDLFLRVLGIRT